MKSDWSLVSRRQALAFLGAAGAASLAGMRSRAWAACSLTPQQTEGPYWVDERLNRSDITVDPTTGAVEPGVPLTLNLNVLRFDASCAPAAGVQVDIWHCNSGGLYSDESANGTAGRKYLRGYQVTDANGAVQFKTIYPGYYIGRTIHIHFRVRAFNGAATVYDFTSQIYFDDALSTQIIAANPLYVHGSRTFNANDGIYSAATQMTTSADGTGGYTGTFDVALNGLPAASTTPTRTFTATPSASPTATTAGPCLMVLVTDPQANIHVRTKDDAGLLRASMEIDLAGYDGEPVTLSLSNGDGSIIATRELGPLRAAGPSGRKWRFRSLADGIRLVGLTNRAPYEQGKFRLEIQARRWFLAAAAPQSADETLLTVQIGQLCFVRSATSKID